MNCPSCNTENVEGARFCAKCGALMPVVAEEERDTMLGQRIAGRFTVKRVLGEGGMGRVYEAEKSVAGVTQRVAVKTLHPHLSTDPQVVARFHRECQTMVKLRHPNTIKVEDFGQTDDGTLFIAMEFVDGTNVAKEIETKGPMSPDRVERILGQVCGSLAEAHKQGVIHRDLKPENIVLMDVGDDVDFVKVLDFGIAARTDSTDAAKEAKLTQQGMVLGTPPYMSPEQFMGKELTAGSDIYSLGVMAYEMLTGRTPFQANTPWEWATQHMTAKPFPFEQLPNMESVPPKMKAAILRSLEKSPELRQPTVKVFFEELSSGSVRMKGTTALGDDPRASVPGVPPTMAMDTFDPAVKGGTQMGPVMPFSTAANPVANPTINPMATSIPTPMPLPLPMDPAMQANLVPQHSGPSAGRSGGGGGGKGLIFGLVAVLVLGVGGVGIAAATGAFGGGGKKHKVAADAPTTDAPPTIPTVSATAPSTSSSSNSVGIPVGGGSKPLPIPPGCVDADKRASAGDVAGAIKDLKTHSCPQGAEYDVIRKKIVASIQAGIAKEVGKNDCSGARRLAKEAGDVGMTVPDVDATYPQCKGR